MDLRFRSRGCFPARFSPEMTSLPLSFSSYSRRFPMSSVSFLDLRLPTSPPPEPPPPPPLEPLPPPTPPEPPDPPDSPPQICFSSSEPQSQLLPYTFSFSLVSLKPESHHHSLSPFLVFLHDTEALLHLPFTMIASQALEFRAACLVFITSSSLPLLCSQVMHLFCTFWNPIVSLFCLDCTRMSIVGKSLAFVRSLTAICSLLTALCSLFPDFVSGIEHMKIVLLPLWQFGLTSLMFMLLVNLVDFSKSLMVSPTLIYLWNLVDFLDCLCLGLGCLSYSFMEMSLLSISLLWGKCLVAGMISFFGDAILSPKDMRFEDLQSHLVSKKPSLRRCSTSAFVVVGFFFPKFPLVSGLDDQDLSVLQGFSSRLIVPSTLVVEFVAFWVAMDAINQEAVEIILVCGSLMFSFYDLYLIYHSFNHTLVVLLTLVALLLCIFFVLVVIPPLFIEIEAF